MYSVLDNLIVFHHLKLFVTYASNAAKFNLILLSYVQSKLIPSHLCISDLSIKLIVAYCLYLDWWWWRRCLNLLDCMLSECPAQNTCIQHYSPYDPWNPSHNWFDWGWLRGVRFLHLSHGGGVGGITSYLIIVFQQ